MATIRPKASRASSPHNLFEIHIHCISANRESESFPLRDGSYHPSCSNANVLPYSRPKPRSRIALEGVSSCLFILKIVDAYEQRFQGRIYVTIGRQHLDP